MCTSAPAAKALTSTSLRGGELDGVAHQVDERPHEQVAVEVGDDVAAGHADLHPRLLGDAQDRVAGSLQDRPEGAGAALELQTSRLDPLEVQDVVDQPDQPLGVGQGHLHEPHPLSRQSPNWPLASRPSEPRTEVSGVRSSWLTTEMNSSLSRSTARRRPMSLKLTTAPVI
jgi:hypothetical protein